MNKHFQLCWKVLKTEKVISKIEKNSRINNLMCNKKFKVDEKMDYTS